MTTNLLVLHPEVPTAVPADENALRVALTAQGLLGESFPHGGQRHYRPGDRFLQLITFLGCSPVVALGQPGPTGEDFCHIALVGPGPVPRFYAGTNVKPPRCPGCGYRAEDWPAAVAAWEQDHSARWRCPVCGREYHAPELKWRQCAGFARFFIEIYGVFEGEAVPGEELLDGLKVSTGMGWTYFYLQRDE